MKERKEKVDELLAYGEAEIKALKASLKDRKSTEESLEDFIGDLYIEKQKLIEGQEFRTKICFFLGFICVGLLWCLGF